MCIYCTPARARVWLGWPSRRAMSSRPGNCLAGNVTTLSELAELIYGAYTPATAWAAWQVVAEGLYFSGEPDHIEAASPEQVAQKQAARQADVAEKRAWSEFLARAQARRIAQKMRATCKTFKS